ncbi:MAG: hypothetical protein HRT82_02570 [Henriciella sp.]|nr:hypothetical protein [Henriciella sp.]
MRAVRQGLLWVLAAGSSGSAFAGTVHHVRFVQPAQILVWEDGELIARGDRIELGQTLGAQDQPLIGAGELLPVQDAATGLRTISVASNTAFSLRSGDTSDISVRVLSIRENGEASAVPAAGTGFRQASKTAIRPGAPESQAIELEITWSGDTAPPLLIVAD